MNKIRFGLDPQTGTLSENDSKKYFSVIGFAVFAFMFISYGASFGVSLLFSKLAPAILDNDIFQSAASLVLQYGVAFPVALAILRRLPKDTNPSEKMGFGKWIGGLCIAFTFMSVGNSVAQFIIGLLEAALGRAVENPIASSISGKGVIVNLVFYVLLAPIIEELIFRKVMCDRLLPLGEGYAVLISALIFGLVHGNLYQFFYAFLTGMLFSAVYIKTGRIRYTVIYHMIINLLGGVVVPWAAGKLEPIMTEEMMARLAETLNTWDEAAVEALSAELAPYMLPTLVLGAYNLVFSVLSIAGVIVLMRFLRKLKFREGLLPPAKEGRVANLFCNAGVATAIAGFAVIFVLSLL